MKALHHTVLHRLGLLRPAFRAREWLRAASYQAPPRAGADGFATPGRLEMVRVVGHANWSSFYQTGKRDAETFAALAAEANSPLSKARAVLDWGCGCGRIARHMPALTKAQLIGRDIDAHNIAWARANLPGDFAGCDLKPPLDLANASVDVVYAMSVLTHLLADTQAAWLQELARVLRPGGIAMLTFHDARHPHLAGLPQVSAVLSDQGFASTTASLEGANYPATFQTLDFLTGMARPWFDLAVSRASDEWPKSAQAVAVLRRRATS